MDPQQTAEYAKAHTDLQDLFREISCHGRVTAHELQHTLLPFTAGDAKRDLQELIDDMKSKQTSLDEPDFIRVMWKKMYLTNVVYTTQHTSGTSCNHSRPSSAGGAPRKTPEADELLAINIPLAHVIVSIKRRSQFKQFANYYATRGISGADYLDSGKEVASSSASRTPRHLLHAQRQRHTATSIATAQAVSVSALRERKCSVHGVVVCCYDAISMRMLAHRAFTNLHGAQLSNCSRLHCFLTSDETGTLVIGSRHFMDHVRTRAIQLYGHTTNDDDGEGDDDEHDQSGEALLMAPVKGLSVTRLDELGLRNIVALGVGRGIVAATTERRVHSWDAFAQSKILGSSPRKPPPVLELKMGENDAFQEMVEFLEDEGDCFGHTPLLKRTKTVSDAPGIRQVACGDRFAVGLTASSELYAWGSGPLGRGKAVPTKVPFPLMAIDASVVVSRVVCGLHHVLLLAVNGIVYSWGSNIHGQLGLGAQCSALDADVREPVEVPLPSVALDVACGDHHSIVLTDKGTLLAWGNNWHGQLGIDPNAMETGCVFTPTKVSWWSNRDCSVDVSHGKRSASSREQPPSSDSEMTSSSSPRKNSQPRVYLITASGDTTAIVTERGCVYTWGKCIPSGTFASACGIVAKWMPQRVDPLDPLLVPDDGNQPCNRDDVPSSSPWASIAIASGVILLMSSEAMLPPEHQLKTR